MAPLQPGDTFPSDVSFFHIPYSEETADIKACGIPVKYDASKEWQDKKVVLFSVPGAFTPTCSVNHLPGYIENLPALKAKGVDQVAVVSFNDAFVQSAWRKVNGLNNNDILFLSDPETKFSKEYAWTAGERTGRYAIIIDHGKVVYAKVEQPQELVVSNAETILAHL